MSSKAFRYSSHNWFGKASAGVLLGGVIAVALTSIYAWVGPGGLIWGGAQPQFVMWLFAPIWALIVSFCFFFRTGLRAWLGLGCVAIILGVALWFVQMNFEVKI